MKKRIGKKVKNKFRLKNIDNYIQRIEEKIERIVYIKVWFKCIMDLEKIKYDIIYR